MAFSHDHLLEVRDLRLSYESDYGRVVALSDMSLKIQPGQAIGLVGESGSGKSTVAAAILDLLPAEAKIESGTILFQGADLGTMSNKARRAQLGNLIGTVFQDPFTSLNPSLRIGQQIAEPLIEHRGISQKLALDRAREMLAEVGIPGTRDVANSYPHQLSGGMQQRALIATALICEPDLLILDEPTTALDVTIEAQLLDLFNDLRERRGLSLLFISHNLAVVRRLCDEAYVLYAGQILERGPSKDLFVDPVHPYTKGLIASLPSITDNHLARLSSIPGHLPDLTDVGAGCVFAPRCNFAVAECGITSQILSDMGGSRAVRCQRSVEVSQIPWNPIEGPGAQTIDKLRCDGKPILQAKTVKKLFSQGGFWESLKLNLPGRSRPIITYEPRSLAAVDGVAMDIYPGEIVGLVGESGSGKSTLGRCLIRLLDTTSGDILFDGKQISNGKTSDIGTLRRDAQIVFQNPDSSLNPRKRVRDIIGRPLELFKLASANHIEDRIQELLAMVNLPGVYAERFPHQLSGGEKQRVGIARALATEPRFIVCDEAVSALDVSVQATIINLFLDLRDKLGLSILFISHDLSVVAHLADRIAVMYSGKICEIGPTSDVLHPPYHPYTHALLSAIPQLALIDGGVKRVRLPVATDGQVVRDDSCNFRARCPHKLGDACDTSIPLSLQPGSQHEIFCHHQLEALVKLESIVPSH